MVNQTMTNYSFQKHLERVYGGGSTSRAVLKTLNAFDTDTILAAFKRYGYGGVGVLCKEANASLTDEEASNAASEVIRQVTGKGPEQWPTSNSPHFDDMLSQIAQPKGGTENLTNVASPGAPPGKIKAEPGESGNYDRAGYSLKNDLGVQQRFQGRDGNYSAAGHYAGYTEAPGAFVRGNENRGSANPRDLAHLSHGPVGTAGDLSHIPNNGRNPLVSGQGNTFPGYKMVKSKETGMMVVYKTPQKETIESRAAAARVVDIAKAKYTSKRRVADEDSPKSRHKAEEEDYRELVRHRRKLNDIDSDDSLDPGYPASGDLGSDLTVDTTDDGDFLMEENGSEGRAVQYPSQGYHRTNPPRRASNAPYELSEEAARANALFEEEEDESSRVREADEAEERAKRYDKIANAQADSITKHGLRNSAMSERMRASRIRKSLSK